MQKANEYKRNAQQCRELAAKMNTLPHREQLLKMADLWEAMAVERESFVDEHPEFRIDLDLNR